MIILRQQKEFSRFEPNFDFVSTLESIATQAQHQFHKEAGVCFEVIYRPNSTNIRAEIHFGWKDRDSVYVQVMKSGKIIDGFNMCPLTVTDLRNQLLGSIDQFQRERKPGTKEKLEFLKAQITSLR